MPVDLLGFAFSGIVASGGIMGYVKAGSLPSLAAGIAFGGALGYGAVEASRSPPNYIPQLIVTSVLAGVMGKRFYNSGKIMPAGLIAVLSGAMLLKIGLGLTGLSQPAVKN